MKSEDSQARNDTATRLSVALKVLETEARQTPGIRRSIDIIKRKLSTGRGGANGQHHYQGPIINNDPTLTSQPTRILQTQFRDQSEGLPTVTRSSSTTLGNHNNSNRADRSGYTPSTNLNLIWIFTAFLVYRKPSRNWDLDVMDTGAGFQPDAFTWSFDEVLEANASAFGEGYNGMMERMPEYETKLHQHIGIKVA